MKEELLYYLEACRRNVEFLEKLEEKISHLFPLKSYYDTEVESKVLIDAFIYRTAKLQELLGKLLRIFLRKVGYNVDAMYPIDIINLAEKLGIVDSSKEWFELRELRNAVNHDYSLLEEELVETINRIYSKRQSLIKIYERLKSKIELE